MGGRGRCRYYRESSLRTGPAMAPFSEAGAKGPWNLPSVASTGGVQGKASLAGPEREWKSRASMACSDFLGLVHPQKRPSPLSFLCFKGLMVRVVSVVTRESPGLPAAPWESLNLHLFLCLKSWWDRASGCQVSPYVV